MHFHCRLCISCFIILSYEYVFTCESQLLCLLNVVADGELTTTVAGFCFFFYIASLITGLKGCASHYLMQFMRIVYFFIIARDISHEHEFYVSMAAGLSFNTFSN